MKFRAFGFSLLLTSLLGCELIGTDEGNRDGTCGQHSSCPHDQACDGANCIDMLSRAFRISAVEVEACDVDLDGVAFDGVDGSSPDLQIELRFGGQTLFSSPVHTNTLMTTFALDVEATLNDFADSFVVEVSDDDGGSATLMDTLSVDIGYPGLRAGEVSVINAADCSESPVTAIRMTLAPTDGAW